MLARHEEANRQIRPDFRSNAMRARGHRAEHRLPQRRQAAFTTKPRWDVDPEDDSSAAAVMLAAFLMRIFVRKDDTAPLDIPRGCPTPYAAYGSYPQ